AGALCDRLFGVHLVWMWKLVFGALGLVLALLGPVGFVRRFVRKIGIWAVAASIVYLAVWILRNGHVDRLWHEKGQGGSFWLGVNLTRYQQFLLLLGAFFVPLFGVLLADWLVAGRHYTREHIFSGPAWRPGMIASWLAGFALYEWITQTQDLGFWTRFLAGLHPPSGGTGASLPGFGVSFALALVAARIGSRVDAASRRNRTSLA